MPLVGLSSAAKMFSSDVLALLDGEIHVAQRLHLNRAEPRGIYLAQVFYL